MTKSQSSADRNPAAPKARKPAGGLLSRLAVAHDLRRWIPRPLKRLAWRWVRSEDYHRRLWESLDQADGVEEVSSYPGKVDVRIGILKDYMHAHRPNAKACREMGVPYRIVDLWAANWLEQIRNSGCAAFLARPLIVSRNHRALYDERLKVIQDMGLVLYPSYDELWMYESKRRMSYWALSHDVPHPQTWVFYSRDDAMDFVSRCDLPIVTKADCGWGAKYVHVWRDRAKLRRFTARCFDKGLAQDYYMFQDLEKGFILFQQFVPEAREYRVMRVGESYFGQEKARIGDFHSGTKLVHWAPPPREIMDLSRQVSDKGGFTSISLDIFATPDGKACINELQSYFGMDPYDIEMMINGVSGRYLYDAASDTWIFEEGIFCQNECGNLRVEALLNKLGIDTSHIQWKTPHNAELVRQLMERTAPKE